MEGIVRPVLGPGDPGLRAIHLGIAHEGLGEPSGLLGMLVLVDWLVVWLQLLLMMCLEIG